MVLVSFGLSGAGFSLSGGEGRQVPRSVLTSKPRPIYVANSPAGCCCCHQRMANDWAKRHLAPVSHVLSDGLACFYAATTARCHHKALVTGGKHPNDLPQFRWINTLLGNLKTSFSGTFHAINVDKSAGQYLGGIGCRFNRRFAITERIANAVCCCMTLTERDLRLAEAYRQSRQILPP